MKSRYWLEQNIEKVLREIGIKKGQTVLDFGCGSGNYTIPTAKIVGAKGRVYALDKNKTDLNELMRKAKLLRLENIRRMETSGELEIDLDDESVDVVLLYDVIHPYYFPKAGDRMKLLNEIYRISKPDALISVYPKHIELKKIKKEMENANFYLKKEYSETLLVHDDKLEEGRILNFKK